MIDMTDTTMMMTMNTIMTVMEDGAEDDVVHVIDTQFSRFIQSFQSTRHIHHTIAIHTTVLMAINAEVT
jgi:hypothetical protein